MNNAITAIFFISLSLLFIVLQSTLLAPIKIGSFSPDLNLILIIIIAMLSDVKGGSIFALGNGYLMDVLSGGLMGVNTLSRLSIYATIRGTTNNVYYHQIPVLLVVIFLSTIFSWFFIWVVIKINSDIDFSVSLNVILKQGAINTLVGVPLYLMIKKTHERIQE
ncbi:MAG: rod shape-determining protein MreD [Thermodesulfobacteriota bacterium]